MCVCIDRFIIKITLLHDLIHLEINAMNTYLYIIILKLQWLFTEFEKKNKNTFLKINADKI